MNLLYRFDEMLEKADFDAAVIVVPILLFTHKSVALKCLEKGKHLFIEN